MSDARRRRVRGPDLRPTEAQLRVLAAAPFDGDSDYRLETIRALTKRGWLEQDQTGRVAVWRRTQEGDRVLARSRGKG